MQIRKDYSPDTDFVKEDSIKNTVVLHGTAGGTTQGADATLDIVDRVNVHYIIERNGDIIQRIPERFWAYHTGAKATSRDSIGIELVCWCNLVEKDGKYLTWTKKEVNPKEVLPVNPPFRGVKFYQNLTDEQVASLKELLVYLKERNLIKKVIVHSELSEKRTDYPPYYKPLVGIVDAKPKPAPTPPPTKKK